MADNPAEKGTGASADGNKPRAKPPSPWSVRGVSREARAKASKAASRRRETIGEWVTNALTQVANEELGTGPRRDYGPNVQSGLPASPIHDESALGKALLALAERFERSEKRNEAINSLTGGSEGGAYGGREVSVMAEQIGLVEQRSRALSLLVERLESSEKRENSLLTMMQTVAERAERGEERIATITRGLADLALNLETVLNRSNSRTAQNISNSVAPLEDAVNALGNRMSSAAARAEPEAPSAATATQYYGSPAGSSAAGGQQPDSGEDSEGAADDGGESGGRLKFDFNKLNARAIENSQKLALDIDDSGEDEESEGGGGWFGKKADADADVDAPSDAKSGDGDDWASEYMVEDDAQSGPADHPHEPTLDEAKPAAPAPEEKPAVSEEDEMLLALKQAIKPDKP